MRVRSFFFGIKPGGGGFLRNSEDQTDTLLLMSSSGIRAIVRHVLKQHPPFPTKKQTRINLLKCFRTHVPSGFNCLTSNGNQLLQIFSVEQKR
jgi:hypothetical protein